MLNYLVQKILSNLARHIGGVGYYSTKIRSSGAPQIFKEAAETESAKKEPSPRVLEFQKKLREKTPIGKLEEHTGKHPFQEKEPLIPWPNNTNPHTGEIGGPAGPEPTRYGDWERKGRVTDF